MRLTRRAALAGIALPAMGVASEAHGADDVARTVRRHCEYLHRSDGLSGAIALARNGRLLLRAAFGQRNRGEALPNRPDTKFNIASIGKLFTSLSMMRLAEAGRVRLDAPLLEAWPDYPNREIAARVTPAQLLTHTAGLDNQILIKPTSQFNARSRQTDLLSLFVDEALEGEPGESVSYSNDGYVLLGALIEKLTDRNFSEHCRATIFEPLGMSSTGYFSADDIVSNEALPYVRDLERPGVWRIAAREAIPGSAAGGAYSTVDDLMLFATALRENRLLSEEWTREWTADRVDFARGRYGYGVEVSVIDGVRIIGHSGGHYGIAGEVMVFEQNGYTCVALTNGEVEPFWDLANFVKTALAGESDASRNFVFTRELIATISAEGVEVGLARAASAPERRPREGVIDTYAFRAWHEGANASAEALFDFNRRTFDSLSALWSIAEFYRYAGRRGDAIAAYRAYLEREPDDADALRYIAELGG